ncbi:MAG: DUF86 domain-containing protein, partial [Candidatus Dadabacteria bacterium]
MTKGEVSERVVAERARWVREMLANLRALPLETEERFFSDPRNLWAAESCLRRALEALLDLGRHLLAKGFGLAAAEYKEIAVRLGQVGVLTQSEADLMRDMAGYRNRMVHFYHEVTPEELYSLARHRLGEIEALLDAMLAWYR